MLKGYKTRIFNAVLVILGAVTTIDPQLLSSVVPVQYHGYVLIFVGVCGYILRELTHTAPGAKGK